MGGRSHCQLETFPSAFCISICLISLSKASDFGRTFKKREHTESLIDFSFQSHPENRQLRLRGISRQYHGKFHRHHAQINFSIFFFLTTRFKSIKVPVCITPVDDSWRSLFFLASISIFFLLPLFILIILYSVIAKHLMINPSLISAQGNRSNFIKYRKQVILMLATVVISFFLCLLPFRAFTLWIILVPTETMNDLLSNAKGDVFKID